MLPLPLAFADLTRTTVPYPADPFAEEYRVPASREVGAAPGQVRFSGGGSVGVGRAGLDLGLQGTLELMTVSWLGVRASAAGVLFPAAGEPPLASLRAGPSVHLLPYRRVDVTSFLEGGLGVVTSPEVTAMPVISPGGTIDVWLSSALFVRLEGRVDWGIYALDDSRARPLLRAVGSLGLGVGL